MALREDALHLLQETSRTFYIPISRLPANLQEAVMSGYLCMRAIDQIEDHPSLDNQTKARLLRAVSRIMQTNFDVSDFAAVFARHEYALEEVTLRIGDWALLAPATIAPRVWEATATMADRMAGWAESAWEIRSEADLDRYTFGVAGSVGLMLSDFWAWYDGTRTDRREAVGFGRGLQAVNIMRNHEEDLARGVDFYPPSWGHEDMQAYACRHLALADSYTKALPPGPVLEFCTIPLALAHATVETLARGEQKLSRGTVLQIVEQALQGQYERRKESLG
jgi:farnesyl-diphosphate farnesyltransferase